MLVRSILTSSLSGLFVSLSKSGGKKKIPPDVSGVLDAVRAMIKCDAMKDAAGILRLLLEMAKEGKLIVVRLKERYLGEVTGGGWRDALINLYIPSGNGAKLKHICELQIAHNQLLIQRENLPGE